MNYLAMRQKGAWWKGLTEDNTEVAISAEFFKKIRAKQGQSAAERPLLVARAMGHYGGLMGCYHPQWWVDCFLNHDYAIGPGQHQWVRRKGYNKLMLGEVTCPGYASANLMGTKGTLIFRTLSAKQAQRIRDFEQEIQAMRETVESFFAEHNVSVDWSGGRYNAPQSP